MVYQVAVLEKPVFLCLIRDLQHDNINDPCGQPNIVHNSACSLHHLGAVVPNGEAQRWEGK